MHRLTLPKVYPITDRWLSGLPHAEQVVRLIAGGARFIQLREKKLQARAFYEEAAEAMRIAKTRQTRLIINDRVDLALAVGADGVHLGQDDLPPEAARRLLGEEAIIGFSTHNVEQAIAAAHLPIDYLAIGPIFPTSSKENPDPVIGLDGLRRVCANVRKIRDLPIVAIGGINERNASSVIEAGADSVAIISALIGEAEGIEVRARKLLTLLDR